jgi:hypothetical protein
LKSKTRRQNLRVFSLKILLGELLMCFVILDQAQRDYFDGHTYQKFDWEGTFHTQWES